MKKIHIFLLLAVLIVLTIPQTQVFSAAPSAYNLIAEVNALRSANGLAELEVNNALMAAAQGQSDYLAATYGVSPPSWDMGHVGAGGTKAIDRAIAAGYVVPAGGYVHENWAAARESEPVSTIVYDMWSDASHWNQMLYADSTVVGAGISEVNGMVYYILNMGGVYGSSGATGGVASTIPTAAVTQRVAPVQVAKPNEDGSIIHVVKQGEALWSIAAAYDVTVDQIQSLNNLSENAYIYVGDELIVRSGYTPTPSPTITLTPRPPTRTPVPPQTAQPIATQEEEAVTASGFLGLDRQTMGLALILICGAGLALVVIGMSSKGKKSQKDQ
jgi:LysM repeat protein